MHIFQHATITLVGAFTSFAVISEGAESIKFPYEAKRLKENHRQALDQGVKPLREKYLAELNRLLEKYTRAGKLEEALAIKNEMSMVPEEKKSGALPTDARQLRQFYQQAVDRNAAPLDEKYVAELTRLMEQFTRAEKLEEALAIKNEINTGFEEKLVVVKWIWNRSLPFQFKKNGTANFGGFKWKTIQPYAVEYTWEGNSGTITFDPGFEQGTIDEIKGNGKKEVMFLTLATITEKRDLAATGDLGAFFQRIWVKDHNHAEAHVEFAPTGKYIETWTSKVYEGTWKATSKTEAKVTLKDGSVNEYRISEDGKSIKRIIDGMTWYREE
jgi:hypothetical protein